MKGRGNKPRFTIYTDGFIRAVRIMASFNKVILIGNLVADPELKQTANGIPVTSFSIAVSRKFTKAGEQPQTDFFDIVCWRTTAEFVTKYFTKGKSILICGSLQTRTWVDNNGTKRKAVEVVADEATFVERKGSEGSAPQQRDGYSAPQQPTYADAADNTPAGGSFEELSTDDELPF